MPQVVEPDQLQPANALVRLGLNSSNVLGAAVGGVAVAAAGPGYAIAFDAATYLASAVVLARMRIAGVLQAAGESVLRELVEGWNEFRSREWLWVIVAAASVGNLVATASLNVLGPLVAKTDLGGASAYGAIVAAQGAGLLLGGVLSLRWRARRPLLVGTLGLLPTAVTIACYAGVRTTAVIATAAFFAGIGIVANPAINDVASTAWVTALPAAEPSIISLRGRRSPSTPPTRTNTICGSQPAARTRPRSVAEPVRSRTANAIATGATAVPRNEISSPVKSSRN